MLALLFQIPGLDLSKPLDHFEAFAGKMSVTKGEWSVPRCVKVLQQPQLQSAS